MQEWAQANIPGRGRDRNEADPHRALYAFGAFGIGLLAARACGLTHAPPLFIASFVLLLGALPARRHVCAMLMLLSVSACGAGWWTLRVGSAPDDALLGWLPTDRETICEIEGVIIEPPSEHAFESGALAPFVWRPPVQRFSMRARAIALADGSSASVSGEIVVDLERGSFDAQSGDRVRVMGHVRGIGPPRNPGEGDRRLWARQDGRAGWMSVPSPELIHVTPRARGPFGELLATARSRAMAIFMPRDEGRGPALMDALILGERTQSLQETQSAFARVGLAHLLSISGLHIAIMAGAVLVLLRAIRDWGRLEAPLLILIVLLYLTLVPSRTPVVRAGVMIIGFAIAEMFGRRHDPVNVLAWIALGVLLWRPMDLWSPGFQLSFGLVLALIVLTRPLAAKLFGERPAPDEISSRQRIGWWFRDAFCASVCAWAVATPAIMCHFGVFSPLAPIVTVLLMPIFVIALCAGYATLIAGLLWPRAGSALAAPADWLASNIADFVTFVDAMPVSSMNTPPVGALWAAGATMVIGWWLWCGAWRDRGGMIATAIVLAWFGQQWSMARLPGDTPLRIDTIDVGEGTCHLMRSGSDAMLWDCGSRSLGVGVRLIPRAVRALGAWRVERIVLTHPNIDHFAGVLDVVQPLGVREVIVGEQFLIDCEEDPDSAAAYMLSELRRRDVAIRVVSRGDAIGLGSAAVEFLAPAKGAVWESDNDASLVARVSVETDTGNRCALFCGDIERDAIGALVAAEPKLSPHVMEAPHHGSAIPQSIQFVESLDPPVAIQSTGPMRRDDERWDDVRAGRMWLSTVETGAAWIEIGADGGIRGGSMLGPSFSVDLGERREVGAK